MNFLADLPISDPLQSLTDTERSELAVFRKAFEATMPAELSCRVGTIEPAFQPTLPLPPCGWRPLDDHTLWRFLVADRRKGAFDQMASAKRLASALLWRKEETVDALIEEPPDAAVKVLSLSAASWPHISS